MTERADQKSVKERVRAWKQKEPLRIRDEDAFKTGRHAFCHHCGKPRDEGDRFCAHCGTQPPTLCRPWASASAVLTSRSPEVSFDRTAYSPKIPPKPRRFTASKSRSRTKSPPPSSTRPACPTKGLPPLPLSPRDQERDELIAKCHESLKAMDEYLRGEQ